MHSLIAIKTNTGTSGIVLLAYRPFPAISDCEETPQPTLSSVGIFPEGALAWHCLNPTAAISAFYQQLREEPGILPNEISSASDDETSWTRVRDFNEEIAETTTRDSICDFVAAVSILGKPRMFYINPFGRVYESENKDESPYITVGYGVEVLNTLLERDLAEQQPGKGRISLEAAIRSGSKAFHNLFPSFPFAGIADLVVVTAEKIQSYRHQIEDTQKNSYLTLLNSICREHRGDITKTFTPQNKAPHPREDDTEKQ